MGVKKSNKQKKKATEAAPIIPGPTDGSLGIVRKANMNGKASKYPNTWLSIRCVRTNTNLAFSLESTLCYQMSF